VVCVASLQLPAFLSQSFSCFLHNLLLLLLLLICHAVPYIKYAYASVVNACTRFICQSDHLLVPVMFCVRWCAVIGGSSGAPRLQ
jgi:hypothetical protein